MNELISVIIPVYKAEAYVSTCINSVLTQSYPQLEILLVDDGSPDGCPAICDSYGKKDGRVRVIHKPNGGASSARNAGLEAAKGRYITFVDSDDMVAPNGLLHLWEALSRTGADYAAGICRIQNSTVCKNPIDDEQYLSFDTQPREVLAYLTRAGSYSPYAKLYKRDLIGKGLRFDESLRCSEDALFIRQYLAKCHSMVLVPHVVYDYNTTNDASLSKKGYEEYCEYYIEKLKALRTLCDTLPLTEVEKTDFLYYRGVHGLRLSTQHYFAHGSSPEEQKRLIAKSMALLLPWLEPARERSGCMDRDTAFWWSTKRSLVYQNRVEDYYTYIRREAKRKHRRKRVVAGIKHTVKAVIGCRYDSRARHEKNDTH